MVALLMCLFVSCLSQRGIWLSWICMTCMVLPIAQKKDWNALQLAGRAAYKGRLLQHARNKLWMVVVSESAVLHVFVMVHTRVHAVFPAVADAYNVIAYTMCRA